LSSILLWGRRLGQQLDKVIVPLEFSPSSNDRVAKEHKLSDQDRPIAFILLASKVNHGLSHEVRCSDHVAESSIEVF
jgi:hypothetical protein